MANEDFNIVKAENLLSTYKRKRQHSKSKFIKELIDYQKFFNPKSILGHPLLLSRVYKKKIAEAVLSDLGYTIINYGSEINFSTASILEMEKDRFSVITFTSTEG